jgi:hypothetical protein
MTEGKKGFGSFSFFSAFLPERAWHGEHMLAVLAEERQGHFSRGTLLSSFPFPPALSSPKGGERVNGRKEGGLFAAK